MSINPVIIRHAERSDIEAIMKIEDESFLPGLREEKELYLKRIEAFKDGFLVALERQTGRIVGYISSELWNEDKNINAEVLALGHDPFAVHDQNGKFLYITSFGVLPDCRGQKIGLQLLLSLEKEIEQKFPTVIKKILIVSEKWLAAKNLYTQQGFKETGRIIDFFLPDDLPAQDAIIMMKAV